VNVAVNVAEVVQVLDVLDRLGGDPISGPCVDERRALRLIVERRYARSYRNVHVVVVDGTRLPRLDGNRGHYETKTGIVIRHPGAYSRKGWSSMIYVASTRRIEVGREWLVAWRLRGGVFTEMRGAS
jgi:hypothetical protein